ncbi:aminopeptidase P N-terminal domain-containing protein [Variovorax brevis]|uniref:aminopeptidase P N-terminal domain-containing protein n=1 Tax=Variovorax brevis TaxID=3053503 RepID=UPI00336591A0
MHRCYSCPPERQCNRDSAFLYCHDSYFFYLTGFTGSDAWLALSAMISAAPCSALRRNLEREIRDLPHGSGSSSTGAWSRCGPCQFRNRQAIAAPVGIRSGVVILCYS